jgi:replicative DNA helicase
MATEYLKDENVEEVILGAILLEYDAYDKVCNIITEDCFYNKKNKAVFNAIESLKEKSEAVDMLTVIDELRRLKKDKLVDVLYISSLTNMVGSAAHIQNHARILVQKYAQRELTSLGMRIQADMTNNEDPFECIDFMNKTKDSIMELVSSSVNAKKFSDVLNESYEEYENRKRLKLEGKVTGIPSVLNKITEHNQGWQGGKLIIIAGRPGMAKTAMALAEARHMANNGYFPIFFSLEMPSRELTDRLLIMQTENNCHDIEQGLMKRYSSGEMTQNEESLVYSASKELANSDVYIDDNNNCDVNHIRSIAKTRQKEGKCSAIFVDYLQLMSSSKQQNREREVAIITRDLKILAKELNVPVFLLCQLNRAVESRDTKRPYMSDLRESGSIEQDADMVIFPWRPKYYIDQDPSFEDKINENMDFMGNINWKETAIMMIAKDRANGVKDIIFKINDSCTLWKDYIFDFKKPEEKKPYDASEGISMNELF